MTCSDVQRVLPEVLDGGPYGTIPTEFETHLKACPDCSDLVSDLQLIVSEARQLEASEEPSPRVWLRIAAELRAEGLIREPDRVGASATRRPVLVPTSPRRRLSSSAWWLTPIAAALVAASAYVVSHKPARQMAQQQAAATPTTNPAPLTTPDVTTPGVTSPDVTSSDNDKNKDNAAALKPGDEPSPTSQQPEQRLTASKDTPSSKETPKGTNPAAERTVEPAPSAEDQQFLSVVSTRAPSLRATYENQLQAVNADIRETEAYVKRNPGDPDARQHLMDAYQQKALLYQIALDRIQ